MDNVLRKRVTSVVAGFVTGAVLALPWAWWNVESSRARVVTEPEMPAPPPRASVDEQVRGSVSKLVVMFGRISDGVKIGEGLVEVVLSETKGSRRIPQGGELVGFIHPWGHKMLSGINAVDYRRESSAPGLSTHVLLNSEQLLALRHATSYGKVTITWAPGRRDSSQGAVSRLTPPPRRTPADHYDDGSVRKPVIMLGWTSSRNVEVVLSESRGTRRAPGWGELVSFIDPFGKELLSDINAFGYRREPNAPGLSTHVVLNSEQLRVLRNAMAYGEVTVAKGALRAPYATAVEGDTPFVRCIRDARGVGAQCRLPSGASSAHVSSILK